MAGKLKLVLCWHMHQPEYRDPVTREFQLPWTYLHGIKDYVDMAAHLEAVPGARVVVNFVPTLLEQLEDYAGQVRAALAGGTALRDPLLQALHSGEVSADEEPRAALLHACLRANEKRLIDRFRPYRRLADLAHAHRRHRGGLRYLDPGYFRDLVVWYHLAWLGETVRRTDARARALIDKAEGFAAPDRRSLLELIGEILTGLIPRYRRLHERGQVELSFTPYAHPIVPLLLDLGVAREAMPEVALPECGRYGGGMESARWQVEEGLRVFERELGFRPAGCWPSEGGVSNATLALLADYGLRWTASGEQVLHHSLAHAARGAGAEQGPPLHRPWRVAGGALRCFFRSDGLSDLIGFGFADWHADDAVGHLLKQLEDIAAGCAEPAQSVVSIILDGENAWEFYPDNGYHFLRGLYERLAAHPGIEMTTFSECVAAGLPAGELEQLVAGSWVYGSFSTWIGERDKNRAWDMLADAGRAFREAREAGRLAEETLESARRQLAVCEGSDWFWWFGDYNPAESVRDFDRLYRLHLENLYRILGAEPPAYLARPFTEGRGSPEAGGTMRRGS